MKEQRESLVENENANNENLLGFDYGVEATLTLFKAIIHSAEVDEEILVHSDKLNPDHDMEEFDLHDLLNHFKCRITMQKNE